MTSLSALLQEGHGWLFVPSAIALGALHGLEPGHSKTMMAAFIVAIRGTLTQAVLLGLSATLSHTAVVWAVALAGLYFGQHWDAEASEPCFQLASAAIIIGVALWMAWRTWRGQHGRHHGHHDDHGDHHHHHDHGHDTGHSHAAGGHAHPHGHTHVHPHDHNHAPLHLDHDASDAHARAHAEDIQRRFAGREVTTGQIIVFGLTGGLIPCPASITVLLLCLQLKQVALGATLVLGFSVGLALTLVASGVVAALGMRHLSRHAAARWPGLRHLTENAPYISSALITLVGLYVGWQGWHALG
ncbi:ABC-type nickel/cobalt efflux system permease component RcnA [Aquabacterium commune]|uniref:Nickel/cobalt efflux system n=1 Tax=Aquabacterium commune TaxID=70586 RepID=A0A4R6RAJ5_9BURK|nr:nickel/cobalt efflux transporter [Aquabacterium commune]TDP83032.1 ABC-type nickel/cobalt efflux system permease component RcnA [Aquabacterium commune]